MKMTSLHGKPGSLIGHGGFYYGLVSQVTKTGDGVDDVPYLFNLHIN
jgi:hypothetical protein